MSYTILTIPFNLKEKAEGDYLKKGFLFDEFFDEFFEENKSGQSFFKVIEFNKSFIKTSVARILLKNAGIDEKKLQSAPNENQYFEEEASFITKAKYLNTINNYYEISKIKKIEELQDKQVKSDVSNLTDIIVNNLKFFIKKEESQLEFEIGNINLVINRQKSNSNIGFGFFVFHLKWIDKGISSPKEFAKHIASVGEFLRWFNNKEDVKTKFYNESCIPAKWNKKLQRQQQKVSFDLTSYKYDDDKSVSEGIYFHDIIDGLLNSIQNDRNKVDFFDFNKNEKNKPLLLHLFQSDVSIAIEKNKDVDDKFLTDIYNSLRIPDKDNVALNLESDIDFSPINPDRYTQLYCINEGAVVIKGNKDLKKEPELINEYYPAFLFALNQKYLFNYMQEKINELPIDDKTGKYIPEALRKLQETMIYAEFSQIFTSLSNYNEIDMFFKKLREQFKVEQLKQEYFDSINGISKITQLKEIEATEETRKKEEAKRLFERNKDNKISEIRSQRLNVVVLFLTIASVWTGFYSSLPLKEWNENIYWWLFNLIIYIILFIIGFAFKKSYDQKEDDENKKKFPDVPNNSSFEKSNTV
jgi:hypothetical protein